MKGISLRLTATVALGSGLLARVLTPEIKVTTRLVLLNVLVHDRSGRPIDDLSKTDFAVTDAGRPQTIALFSVDRLAPGSAGAPPTTSLPRNIVANRPISQVGAPASVTVVLVDTYNTKLTDQGYANRQLIQFLKKVRPEDRIAIYTLNSNGFAVVHDFTSNAESLRAAIARTAPRPGHQLEGSAFDPANTTNDRIDTMLDESNMVMSNFFTRDRIVNTCASFKSLADHLSGIPGRKNVVWITGSVPMEIQFGDPEDARQAKGTSGGATDGRLLGRSQDNPQMKPTHDRGEEHFASYVEETGRALNNANVAVYPVDARGLLVPPFTEASRNVKPDPKTHNLPASALYVDNRNAMTMDYIASLTGGKAFHDANDLAEAVRKAIDDSSVTYTLGYYVPDSEWDNGYHKVKVAVTRPGMNVRTKKGYLAQDKPAPTGEQLEDALREAIWSPLDSTRVAITARIDPSPALPNASRFSFAIDPAGVDFRRENGKYRAQVDVLFVQQRKGGEHAAGLKKTLTIAVTTERYQVLRANGVILTEDLRMHPDTVAVRIIVLDRSSGATGSVTVVVGAEDKSGPNGIPATGQTAPH